MDGADRRFSFRSSLVWFVLLSAIVGAAAVGLLVLLDPRAQAFWATRWEELATAVRGFLRR